GTILGEIVEADDLVAGRQEFLDEVARDEPGRARDEDFHDGNAPLPKIFQISMTGLESGSLSCRYSRWGAPTNSRSDRATNSSSVRNRGSWMYTSVQSTSAASTSRTLRSLYESDSRGSSLSALKAMPSRPTHIRSRG